MKQFRLFEIRAILRTEAIRLKDHLPASRTRFVQPGKIEIGANERAVIGNLNAAFSFAPSSILSLTIYRRNVKKGAMLYELFNIEKRRETVL